MCCWGHCLLLCAFLWLRALGVLDFTADILQSELNLLTSQNKQTLVQILFEKHKLPWQLYRCNSSLLWSANCSHRWSGVSQPFWMFRGVMMWWGRDNASYDLTHSLVNSSFNSSLYSFTQFEGGIIFATWAKGSLLVFCLGGDPDRQ